LDALGCVETCLGAAAARLRPPRLLSGRGAPPPQCATPRGPLFRVDAAFSTFLRFLRLLRISTQILYLLNTSKTAVVFIDDNQIVQPGEIGSTEYIKLEAQRLSCTVAEFELEAQVRCGGSDNMISPHPGAA
jgi:hypothetical protein